MILQDPGEFITAEHILFYCLITCNKIKVSKEDIVKLNKNIQSKKKKSWKHHLALSIEILSFFSQLTSVSEYNRIKSH